MRKLLLLFLILLSVNRLSAEPVDKYSEINQSFELYGELYRLLLNNYVLELSPEELTNSAIKGILSSLDPYTEYYSEKEKTDVEKMTQGTYIGFGITVTSIDSAIAIENVVEGFSAYKNGVRPGDIIYKIDSTVVINLNIDSLGVYTGGTPSTIADVWLIRGKDTLLKKLTREKIERKDVAYCGFINDSIAYISLSGFTKTASYEIRGALNSLNRIRKPAGLILDLRNNPGGLVQSAVAICELFLQQGDMVVSIKGNNDDNNAEFKTFLPPDMPDIKLAVLINGMSASASEIVAGAVQDLDRGVVLGTRSFGKGLVQSFFPLPFKAQMKVTTARYYTPSGRCIQRRNFADAYQKDNGFVEDTNKVVERIFKTKNGRDVKESHGIDPDSLILPEKFADYLYDLSEKHTFFKFGTIYTSGLDSLPKNFAITESIIKDFKKYLDSTNYQYETEEVRLLRMLRNKAFESGADAKIMTDIEDINKIFLARQADEFNKNKDIIKKALEQEILTRFYPDRKILERFIPSDNLVQSACSILTSKVYENMLKKKN
ncbi:MAG: S41 family peptidase [bacterium]